MKPKFKTFVQNVQKTISKNSPQILMGIGITGMFTTVVLAVKATPKALECIEETKAEQDVTELTVVDTVKSTWKCYVPAAVTGLASTACLLGSNSVNTRRTAALATAYKISEAALAEYKDKVVEVIGEKKEQQVREKVAKARLEGNPVSTHEIIYTNKGGTLCYEPLTGRYFTSSADILHKAENEINRKLNYDWYVSLNEFFVEIGLEPSDLGNDLGWNSDMGLMKLDFYAQLTDKDEPCLVLDYNIKPKYEYSKLC